MADKIQKALAKLNAKERFVVEVIIKKLLISDFKGLDIKQLTGHSGVFRARKGRIRIIFTKSTDEIFVISIARRNEKTYKDF